MATISEALSIAVGHHQAGRLALAEEIYRRVLAVEPDQPDALHLLGVVEHCTGRNAAAVEHIRRVIELQPDFADAHSNLGDALKAEGRLDEAIVSYGRALQLCPTLAGVHNNLGNAYQRQGRFDEAVACYRRALEVQPERAEVHNNLGNVLKAQGKADDAVACYQRAVQLQPDYAEAHNNLGIAWKELGKVQEAIASYECALRAKPNFARACYNRAVALQALGRRDDAIAGYRQTVQLDPERVEAYNNLGNLLKELHRLDDAAASYRRAIAIRPDYAEAHNNLGVVFREQGNADEAAACHRRAIQLKPTLAGAHNNLGNACKDQAQLDEAISYYRRALELQPDFAAAHSNIVYALAFSPACDPRTLLAELRQWDARHARPLSRGIAPHDNDPSPDRRLRIGYVSACFRDHCQAFFTTPLFAAHDHDACEIVLYSDVARPDAVTAQLRSWADVWRDVVGLDDDRLARFVRDDRIDILVDLTMHMADNRLLMFARKPAPVQVCWLAYPGSTGLSTMDYRLTDPYLDPPGAHDELYAEESLRLPDTFWCYDPITATPDVNALPALERGYVTFGSLNNFCKVNSAVLGLWARVLRAVERSRLVLLAPEGDCRREINGLLQREGVDPQRVTFVALQPRRKYLETYHGIDLGLDTLPYNGHTTSLDSYWMGVPVVTITRPTVVGRAGLSQLTNLGLPELVAATPDEFVRIAAGLAADLPRLGALRNGLRQRMRESPLMDGRRFARNIEAAYRTMWRRWCQSAATHERKP